MNGKQKSDIVSILSEFGAALTSEGYIRRGELTTIYKIMIYNEKREHFSTGARFHFRNSIGNKLLYSCSDSDQYALKIGIGDFIRETLGWEKVIGA